MTSLPLDVLFFGPDVIGIPPCWNCISSWFYHDGNGGTAPDAMVWNKGGISHSPPPPPPCIPVSQSAVGKKPGMGASFSWSLQVSWAISLGDCPDFFHASPVHITPALACGHGLSSRHRESCDIQIIKALLDFYGYPERPATELHSGTLKLRYSSLGGFPPGQCPILPVVLSRFHFPDGDPVNERPAKRFRITGESLADKRARDTFGELPTPLRWKRYVLQGSWHLREVTFFLAWGLVDELVRDQRPVAAGQGLGCFQPRLSVELAACAPGQTHGRSQLSAPPPPPHPPTQPSPRPSPPSARRFKS